MYPRRRRRTRRTFSTPTIDVNSAVDAAYHAKYDHYGPQIVGTVVGSHARP